MYGYMIYPLLNIEAEKTPEYEKLFTDGDFLEKRAKQTAKSAELLEKYKDCPIAKQVYRILLGNIIEQIIIPHLINAIAICGNMCYSEEDLEIVKSEIANMSLESYYAIISTNYPITQTMTGNEKQIGMSMTQRANAKILRDEVYHTHGNILGILHLITDFANSTGCMPLEIVDDMIPTLAEFAYTEYAPAILGFIYKQFYGTREIVAFCQASYKRLLSSIKLAIRALDFPDNLEFMMKTIDINVSKVPELQNLAMIGTPDIGVFHEMGSCNCKRTTKV